MPPLELELALELEAPDVELVALELEPLEEPEVGPVTPLDDALEVEPPVVDVLAPELVPPPEPRGALLPLEELQPTVPITPTAMARAVRPTCESRMTRSEDLSTDAGGRVVHRPSP